MARWFDDEEFVCRCGECLFADNPMMDEAFVAKLDVAREKAGVVFVVRSGRRCSNHNEEVGGHPQSKHLEGTAADIRAMTSRERLRVVHGALQAGFDQIGVYRTFVHLQMGGSGPKLWLS